MAIRIEAPAPEDFPPYAARYISRVSGVADPIAELALQRERFSTLFGVMSEAAAAFRYETGKWSIKDLVCHMADTERIFTYRLLRIARGDETPLAGFEEDDYARAAAADRRTLRDLVDEWFSVRAATITLVGGLPEEAWTRSGTANNQTITAGALLYLTLGHTEHHAAVLRDRYSEAWR